MYIVNKNLKNMVLMEKNIDKEKINLFCIVFNIFKFVGNNEFILWLSYFV